MADRYWVSGSGNWSDTGHWSTSSGGASGASVPTSADNAIFDAASNTTAYTVTMDVTGNCLNLDATNPPSVSGALTLSGGGSLNIYGHITMHSGMYLGVSGSLQWIGTDARNLTSNGATMFKISVAGTGAGVLSLVDTATVTAYFNPANAGTFNANSQKVKYLVPASGSNLYAGTFYDLEFVGPASKLSQISVGGNPTITGTLTITGDSATNRINVLSSVLGTARTITAANVALSNCDFMDITGAGAATWEGTLGSEIILLAADRDFSSDTGNWNRTAGVTIGGGVMSSPGVGAAYGSIAFLVLTTISRKKRYAVTYTIKNYVSGLVGVTVGGNDYSSFHSANGTYTDYVSVVNMAANNRLYFANGNGAAFVGDIDDVSIKEVNALGDALGNSGITFAPAASIYWKTTTTGSKNWSDINNWSLTSGGTTGGMRVPLPQDSCVFDASSIGAASTTITADMPRLGKDITWTGVTNSPTWSSSVAWDIYGSLTCVAGMTVSENSGLSFRGRGSHTITSAGNTFNGGVNFYAPGGTYTMQDALATNNYLSINLGTFTTNYNVTAVSMSLYASQNTAIGYTVNMGSGTWTTSGGFYTHPASRTLNAQTSTIKLTGTASTIPTAIDGFGATFYNAWFSGVARGVGAITGSNTFNNLKIDPGLLVQVAAGTTQTAASYTIDGRASTGTDAPEFYLPGDSASFLSSPTKTITGNWKASFDMRLADYTPSANANLAMKLSGNNGFAIRLLTTGHVQVQIGNGAGITSASYATSFTDGGIYALDVVWTDGVGFTVAVNGGAPSASVPLAVTMTDAPVNCDVGSASSGSVTGAMRRFVLTDNASTTYYDCNASRYTGSGNTFTAATGETWTRNGNAQFTGTNHVTIMGATNATYTLATTGAAFDPKFVSFRNCISTAGKITAHYSLDGGSNTNITFTPARYWVGGSGNWSDTAHWSLGSGGPSGASVPSSSIDSCFDSKSNATAYAVTNDSTANASKDLLFGAAPATSGTVTLSPSASHFYIYGNITLLSGMTFSPSLLDWAPTSGVSTLTSNGVNVQSSVTLYNNGGTFKLADAASISGILSNVGVAGNFNANGNLLTLSSTASTGQTISGPFTFASLTRVGGAYKTEALTLTADITVTGTFTVTGNSVTNRILLQSNTLGTPRTITAGAVSLTNTDLMDITGAGTANWSAVLGAELVTNGGFDTDTVWSKGTGWAISGGKATHSVGTTASLTIPSLLTIGKAYTVTFDVDSLSGSTVRAFCGGSGAGPTVSGPGQYSATITCAGDTTLYIQAGSGATCQIDNVSVKPAIDATSIGDCLGNSGITFTPAETQTATGTASFTWSTHGWTSRVPLPQDDVVIPNAFVAGRTITMDMPRMGKSITFSCTGSPTLSMITPTTLYGSLTLASGMTYSGGSNLTFNARTGYTITSAGVSINSPLLMANLPAGASLQNLTLNDALTITSASGIALGTCGLNVGSNTLTSPLVSTSGNHSNPITGSGTILLTGSGTAWNINGSPSITHSGLIKLTDTSATAKTFAGAGKTYNNVWFSGTGTGPFIITGSNTFAQLKKDDPRSPLQIAAGSTQTVADWQVNGNETGTGFTTYHADHEGIPHALVSGENPAGQQGKRRINNLVADSDSTSAWTKLGTTPPTDATTTFSGDTYSGVTFATGTGAIPFTDSRGIPVGSGFSFIGRKYSLTDLAVSLKIALSRPLVGSEQIAVYITGNAGLHNSILLTSSLCPTTPTRLGVVTGFNGDLNNASPIADGFYIHPNGTLLSPLTVYAKYLQVEDVRYASNRNPGEYVDSTNGLGVQYFDTLNGNTLSGYTVIEAVGAAITPMTTQIAKQVVESFRNDQSYTITGTTDLNGWHMHLRRATATSNGRTYYAGSLSTDGGNNVNWTFSNGPQAMDSSVTQGANTESAASVVAVSASHTKTQDANTETSAGVLNIVASSSVTDGPQVPTSAGVLAIVGEHPIYTQGDNSITWDTDVIVGCALTQAQEADTLYLFPYPTAKFWTEFGKVVGTVAGTPDPAFSAYLNEVVELLPYYPGLFVKRGDYLFDGPVDADDLMWMYGYFEEIIWYPSVPFYQSFLVRQYLLYPLANDPVTWPGYAYFRHADAQVIVGVNGNYTQTANGETSAGAVDVVANSTTTPTQSGASGGGVLVQGASSVTESLDTLSSRFRRDLASHAASASLTSEMH